MLSASSIGRRARFSICVAVGLLYFILSKGTQNVSLEYERWSRAAQDRLLTKPWEARGLDEVTNATLGFQEIFIINLPSRTDRRDSMALAGGLTSLHFTFVDGVDGDAVKDRILPADSVDKFISPGNKGSWRAHMNVLRRIIEDNISTALIMEDDIDWDIRLKSQMQSLALASRVFLQPIQGTNRSAAERYSSPSTRTQEGDDNIYGGDAKSPTIAEEVPWKSGDIMPSISINNAPRHTKPTTSPFGDNWDVLWLGHCGTDFPSSSPPGLSSQPDRPATAAEPPLLRVTIPDDPTVPVARHLRPHPFALEDTLAARFPPHTRVVHAASGTLCTQAYAVSQRGARKLLYQFGLETFTTGWDLMLRDWCDGRYVRGEQKGRRRSEEGKEQESETEETSIEPLPQCLTVQPPLFSHYMFPNKESGSDIQAQGGGYLHKSGSQYIRLSVRANFRRLVNGEGIEGLVDQWPDEEEKGL